MKAVPDEPTQEMLHAGIKAFQHAYSSGDPLNDWRAFYKAALAAAPDAPPADEPVAWFYTTGLGVNAEMSNNRFSHGPKRPDERAGWIPLYARGVK